MSEKRRREHREGSSTKNLERVVPDRLPSPFEELERWLEGRLPHYWPGGFRWGMPPWLEFDKSFFEAQLPCVDVIERDDTMVVRAELSGVTKEDIDVSLTDDSITIKAETSHRSEDEEGDYHRSEIARGRFSRTLALPSAVDQEKAEAKFHDGVLELTLPKREQAKRRHIAVA